MRQLPTHPFSLSGRVAHFESPMKSATIAILAFVVVFAAGCKPSGSSGAAAGKAQIAFVSNGVASFWTIAAAGVKAAGEQFGVDAETFMPVEGISDQKRIVEDLLTRGFDGIAISPIDPANQSDLLNAAAKRTRLITHDSDAPASERLVYIGMDNYKAGRLCGELVREAMPGGGTVMLFIGRLEQDNARSRRQGCVDAMLGRPEDPKRFDPPSAVIEEAGFKILGTLTDNFDRVKAKANVEDTLAKYPDIGGMAGLFVYNPPLILEVLAQAGKTGKVKVVGFDEDDATLAAIEAGHVHATVVQNPYLYGFKSVEVLSELAKGNTGVIPAGKMIDIPARQIRRADVAAFRADLKAKLGAAK
jgi:ribose transport system substrate-binding protein